MGLFILYGGSIGLLLAISLSEILRLGAISQVLFGGACGGIGALLGMIACAASDIRFHLTHRL